MSTAVAERVLSTAGRDVRPSFLRLTAVELRKMVDTRAGLWLQALTLVAMIGFLVLQIVFAVPEESTFKDMVWVTIWPATLLLPIVGILLVTSEWSQRTSLITFALVPQRTRVIAAKVGAALVLSFVALAVSYVLGTIGTVIDPTEVDDKWSLSAVMVGQSAVFMITAMLIGVAFGALFLSSPPGIVLYFVLPITWSFISLISIVRRAGAWLDTNQTLSKLGDAELTSGEWARVGTTLLLWLALPLVAGILRIRRSEIS